MEESVYLQVLRDTAEALASGGGPRATFDRTVEILARRLHFDVCSIYVFDPTRRELVLAATRGLAPASVGRVRMKLGEGLTGHVGETERPVFVSEARDDPHFKYFPETGEERFHSFGGVPLSRRGELLGVLAVQTERVHAFHTNDVFLLQALASQVASILDVSTLLPGEGDEEKPSAPVCLIGLGTSPGIGMAKAIVLGQDPMLLSPPAELFSSVDEEKDRLAKALEKAVERALSTADRLVDGGAEAAAIFRAHAQILRDPRLRSRIEERIASDRMPASQAVDRVLRETVETFEAREDPFLRDSVHDLLDVRMQILTGLGVDLGVEVAGEEPVVVMAEFLTPAQTASLDRSLVAGIVTEHGSETSHASILARSRGIPAVVAVPDLLSRVRRGDLLLVDGVNGFVFVNPDPDTIRHYEERRLAEEAAAEKIREELARVGGGRPARDGFRLSVNLDLPAQVAPARRVGATSVGLLRTEFFYMRQRNWPTEEKLEGYFRRIFHAFRDGEVTVRLLDLGGEKNLPYAEPIREPNPILGFRSIRFLLEHPAVYRTQIRTILAAAAAERTAVRIMVPMISAPWEMRAARELFVETALEGGHELLPPFGMMIEVPSVLYELEHYAPVSDFFSVGTNDLVQYLLAVDRDNEQVKNYYNPFQPAVVRALVRIVDDLAPTGRPLAVCGEMAGRPLSALALLALGYRDFSVRARVFHAIGALTFAADDAFLAGLRAELLRLDSDEAVAWALRSALRTVAPYLLGV